MNDAFAKRLAFPTLPIKEVVPGVVLVLLVTAAAYGLHGIHLFATVSPMMGAILIGILFNNTIGSPVHTSVGIAVCGKKLLRVAVALLGFQLTIWQVSAIGIGGVAMVAAVLASTFVFTLWLGRLMGIDRGLSILIAAGTSVCGASAIAAMNDVSKSKEEDVAYAIAAITLFGTVAMFLYPLLKNPLALSANSFGFWTGVSVHEVAQVVAAAFQAGDDAGQAGVVVKLTRVMMLAPLLIMVSVVAGRRTSSNAASSVGQPIPLFVVSFIGCMLLNSLIAIPDEVRSSVAVLTSILLTASLGAIGLGTSIGRLRIHGFRPFILAAASTIFIALVGLFAASFVA